MEAKDKSNWIATVYSDGEKVDSHCYKKMTEDEANKDAKIWIDKFHAGRDWSRHKLLARGEG